METEYMNDSTRISTNSLSGLIEGDDISMNIVQKGLSGIIPELVPEWYFFILLSLIISLAIIKLLFFRYIFEYISSCASYQLSTKVFNDVGIVRKRVGYLINIVYLVSGGLYLYILSEYYEFFPYGYRGLELFLLSAAVLLIMELFRYITAGGVSLLFDRRDLFREYIFHLFLYNKVLGIILFPFVILIPYTEGVLYEFLIYTSIISVILVYLVRIVRIILFVIKNVVLLFYLFLYLCLLEIIPLLLIIRLIMSLEQGS